MDMTNMANMADTKDMRDITNITNMTDMRDMADMRNMAEMGDMAEMTDMRDMEVELIRLEKSPEGVFGILRVQGSVHGLTLEPPDKGNRPNISCIPAGKYICKSRLSRRFGQTFEVADVPDRSDILFHSGNVAEDSRGCILLGKGLGQFGEKKGIVHSKNAVQDFLQALGKLNTFSLSVTEPSLL